MIYWEKNSIKKFYLLDNRLITCMKSLQAAYVIFIIFHEKE